MADLHRQEFHGRGFLVLPVHDPSNWGDEDFGDIVEAIDGIPATDKEQRVDLGRFIADADPYYVR
jgi:hypothetical protein